MPPGRSARNPPRGIVSSVWRRPRMDIRLILRTPTIPAAASRLTVALEERPLPAVLPVAASVPTSFATLVRHQNWHRDIADQVRAHAAEEALDQPGMAVGAGDDEIRLLPVEA